MPTLKRTPKKENEIYNKLYANAVHRLEGMMPKSTASKMYPKLQTEDERRRREKQQKE
jgi:hypothetical protein